MPKHDTISNKKQIRVHIQETLDKLDVWVSEEFTGRGLDKEKDTLNFSLNYYTYAMLFCSEVLKQAYISMIEFQNKESRPK